MTSLAIILAIALALSVATTIALAIKLSNERGARVNAEGRVTAALITIEAFTKRAAALETAEAALVGDALRRNDNEANAEKQKFAAADPDRRADLLRELLAKPIAGSDTCAADSDTCAGVQAAAGASTD